MPDTQSRAVSMRALHAEARKRGLGHDELHDLALQRFGKGSLGELTAAELRRWAGELRRAQTPRSGQGRRRQGTDGTRRQKPSGVVELAGSKELELIGGYAEALGWGRDRLDGFIRRQLGERGKVRTLAEANKVIHGLKALYRRERAETQGGEA